MYLILSYNYLKKIYYRIYNIGFKMVNKELRVNIY